MSFLRAVGASLPSGRPVFFVTRLEHITKGGVSAWNGAGTARAPPPGRLGVNGKSVENAIPTWHARGRNILPLRPAGPVNIAHMVGTGAACRVWEAIEQAEAAMPGLLRPPGSQPGHTPLKWVCRSGRVVGVDGVTWE